MAHVPFCYTLSYLVLSFSWATIPFSYLLSRFFKDSTVGFMAVFIVHMTIAFNMACAKLMLDLLQGRSVSDLHINDWRAEMFLVKDIFVFVV